MPLTSGVLTKTLLVFILPKPKPLTVARWSFFVPIKLLISVTFTWLDMHYPNISSTDLPRLAAISDGVLKESSALRVARTKL